MHSEGTAPGCAIDADHSPIPPTGQTVGPTPAYPA
jgi:hypothetical protein